MADFVEGHFLFFLFFDSFFSFLLDSGLVRFAAGWEDWGGGISGWNTLQSTALLPRGTNNERE